MTRHFLKRKAKGRQPPPPESRRLSIPGGKQTMKDMVENL